MDGGWKRGHSPSRHLTGSLYFVEYVPGNASSAASGCSLQVDSIACAQENQRIGSILVSQANPPPALSPVPYVRRLSSRVSTQPRCLHHPPACSEWCRDGGQVLNTCRPPACMIAAWTPSGPEETGHWRHCSTEYASVQAGATLSTATEAKHPLRLMELAPRNYCHD